MQSAHDFHHASLGLAEAVLFTLLFTDVLKVVCGRYRPDWYGSAPPPNNASFFGRLIQYRYARQGLSGAIISDGRQSFPSGHASVS